MRRTMIWVLVLALILLCLCVLWLLPRLLREEPPPPESSVADAAAPAESTPAVEAPAAPAAEPPAPTAPAVARSSPEVQPPPRAAAEPVLRRGSLAGRLVDRSGTPVAHAAVLAAHAPDLGAPIDRRDHWISHLPLDVADPAALGAEVPSGAESDEAGRFSIAELEPGRVRLAVRSERTAPLDVDDLRLAAGEARDLGQVVLDAPVRIQGAISDADGRGVAGVPLVRADDFACASLPALSPESGRKVAVSTPAGTFRSLPVPPGPWSLRALGGSRLADIELRGDTAEGAEVLAAMPAAAWITGRIATRSPLAEELCVRAVPAETARGPVPVRCRADVRTGRVGRDGSFLVDGLAAGELYELRATRLGQEFEDESLWSPPAFATAPDESARIAWEADASLTFRLLDAADRSMVSPAELRLVGALPACPDPVGLSGAPGLGLVLDGVRPERPFFGARLRASSRGFQPVEARLELHPGSATPLGELAMSRLPRLAVHVVDAETSAPILGALVTATEGDSARDASGLAPASVASDARGQALVPSFAGSASRIEVRARGHSSGSFPGPFGAGYASPRLDVRLGRGAIVRIRVQDDAGHAVPGARVELAQGTWSPNEAPRGASARRIADRPDPDTSRIADAAGRVAFPGLAPGRHAFRVQRWFPYRDSEWTVREVAEGTELDLVLESPARASLTVRASDRGRPLSGAPAVLLRRADAADSRAVADPEETLPPGLDARLDARGSWTFRDVDPGPYVLALFVGGQRLRACREIRVKEGSNVLSFDLAPTAVAGRVLRSDGSPAAGAEILLVESARARRLGEFARWRGLSGSLGDEILALALERPAAVADENGEFRLVGLRVDTPWTVMARAGVDGVGSSDELIAGAEAGVQDIEVRLNPAGAVEILPDRGQGSGPCTVLLVSRDRRTTPRVRRMFPGRAEVVSGLEPGEWDIEVASPETSPGLAWRNRRSVEVAAAATHRVSLSVP
jgi:hypothetical protein